MRSTVNRKKDIADSTGRARRRPEPIERAKRWSLREARAKFSELVRRAQERPQCVTRRGRDAAILLSVAEFERLQQPRESESGLVEFLADTGFSELDLRRRTDLNRDTEF